MSWSDALMSGNDTLTNRREGMRDHHTKRRTT